MSKVSSLHIIKKLNDILGFRYSYSITTTLSNNFTPQMFSNLEVQ